MEKMRHGRPLRINEEYTTPSGKKVILKDRLNKLLGEGLFAEDISEVLRDEGIKIYSGTILKYIQAGELEMVNPSKTEQFKRDKHAAATHCNDFFAKNLRFLLQKNHNTIKSLAENVNSTSYRITQYIFGEFIPTEEDIRKIASYYRITQGQLMNQLIGWNEVEPDLPAIISTEMQAAFLENIICVMEDRGWTIAQFANLTRVSKFSASQYIKSATYPSLLHMLRISDGLQIGLLDMLETAMPSDVDVLRAQAKSAIKQMDSNHINQMAELYGEILQKIQRFHNCELLDSIQKEFLKYRTRFTRDELTATMAPKKKKNTFYQYYKGVKPFQKEHIAALIKWLSTNYPPELSHWLAGLPDISQKDYTQEKQAALLELADKKNGRTLFMFAKTCNYLLAAQNGLK